ncbi:hypothetical protein [uncultured Aquitalea sp.]|uniref:cytochrome b n=1 Tax=uncultured Aquitalea sp. TaxID=540272 RepID=UPI0025CECD5F|nr:hypothetical protein [uncultured Aquitalea sp.]
MRRRGLVLEGLARVVDALAATDVQRRAVHAAHLAIYGLLLAVCMGGWVIVNAKGLTIPMPGLGFDFPRQVEASPVLVRDSVRALILLAWLIYSLLRLHICAALWHHSPSRTAR